MKPEYTIARFDFEKLPWLTSPRKQLDTEAVALGFIRIPPGEGYTFTHSHRKQEEVYIVIEGNGIIAIGKQLIEISRGDVVRVSPQAKRALKAHNEGLFVICAGGVAMGFPKNENSRYMIDDGMPDYDDIPQWHQGNPEIIERNNVLKKRMHKATQKRAAKDHRQNDH